MTKLIIARHGNTFTADQTPTRVGARTDMPLVEKGKEQAKQLGLYLKQKNLIPDVVYASPLKRTFETAKISLENADCSDLDIITEEIFKEIDYGPDENKTEDEVIARIGKEAIEAWDKEAIVPPGWQVDPAAIIQNLKNFAKMCEEKHAGKNILVLTSNGIARFSPYLTGDFDSFAQDHKIKISPGALAVFEKESTDPVWTVTHWNTKPKDFLA